MKKQQLNTKLYQLHLLLANMWGNTWQYIQHTINRKVEKETKAIYQRLDNKLHNLAQQQMNNPKVHHTFYPRIQNNTDCTFSSKEIGLLEKGPKYNLHNKKKNWFTNLALAAETAISLLPTTDREYFRNQVSDHLQKLKLHYKTNAQRNHQSEHRTMKSIQTKLKENDAIITTADKGNSLVMLQTQQYKAKIQDFIDENSFQSSMTNPTKCFQNQVRKTINHSTALIPRDSKWRYVNLNPSVPTIKGLIKLHKPDQPIRPIVNWRNATAYKLSQLLATKIRPFASLPYTFSVKNSTELIQELKQTPITPTSMFASLDITNMYSNIPIKETKQILKNMLASNMTDHKMSSEILNCYEVITKQNYFPMETG